jgi:polar amino acid transport system substrate-binding protein
MIAVWLLGGGALSARADSPEEIVIVTPKWEKLTRKDGTGLYFEMLRSLYEPAGVSLKYEIVPWKRAKKMLLGGLADALPAAYLTPDDPAWIYPAHPMDTDVVKAVFLRNGPLEWNGASSVAGKRAVWPRGYNFHNYLDVAVTWNEIDKPFQGWRIVESGRADVYLDIEPVVTEYLKDHPGAKSRFSVETIFTINTYLRFANTERSKRLIGIFDRRMPELIESGEMARLFRKWRMPRPAFLPAAE